MEKASYVAHTNRLKQIVDEMAQLKEQKKDIETRRKSNRAAENRLSRASAATEQMSPAITEWNEHMIRQLAETVKVISADRLKVYFRGGLEILESEKFSPSELQKYLLKIKNNT